MLDIKLVRENPELVKKAMRNRGVDPALIEGVLKADAVRLNVLQRLEERRAAHNQARKPSSPQEKEELKREKQEIKDLEGSLATVEEALREATASLPNIPLDETPVGKDSSDNVEVSVFGGKPDFAFTPKHYMDIAQKLGIIDTETAGQVSGTRFGYLLGGAALLEFAILQYAASKLTEKGFVPVIPPVLIRPEMMRAMGFAERAGVERGSDEIYFLPKDDLYLVGTSEQSIGPMHYDRILKEDQLPLRYLGFSTCFRRESGAAGKDTRGILRVHQFDKLEMFSVTKPDSSRDEHQLLLACEEALMQGLELHYRVVRLCTGDIGQASAATYDIETWMPGQGEYRETHSTSNTTDYQSRALKTRYQTKDGTQFVHMLNGTAFAIGRMIIAIIENYQTADGTITVPEVLCPYMGGMKEIK